MPLKLNVGLSRKVGLPRYGSVGASCAVEVELDQGLLFHDIDTLHQKVQEAFAACRQAVAEELDRQEAGSADSDVVPPENNGHGSSTNEQRHAEHWTYPLPATERQKQAIEGIAARQRIHLPRFLRERGGKDCLNDLTRAEASRLIDELQAADRVPVPE